MVVGIVYSLFESVTRTYLSALRVAGVATAVVFPKGSFIAFLAQMRRLMIQGLLRWLAVSGDTQARCKGFCWQRHQTLEAHCSTLLRTPIVGCQDIWDNKQNPIID